MPEANRQPDVPQAQEAEVTAKSPLDAILEAQDNPTPEEEAEEQDEAEENEAEERKLTALLRKAEQAFCRGKKAELLSRVDCGKWCHEVYSYRLEQGHKDRGFTSQLIFNRLAIHADSKRECDASELAHVFKCVDLLCTPEQWKALAKLPPNENPLTIGKLLQLKKLVHRVEGTEVYTVFDKAKVEECKALFAWACQVGLKKTSLEDVTSRVLELLDPTKYAQRVEEKKAKEAEKEAEGAEDTAADEEDEEEAPAPENLISTDAARPAAPSWKDVPEGMAALLKEGNRQQPGKSADMMCDFAKELVWTVAMAKGLVDGIANSKDAESAQAAMQALVNTIADEYSIYPESELEDAA